MVTVSDNMQLTIFNNMLIPETSKCKAHTSNSSKNPSIPASYSGSLEVPLQNIIFIICNVFYKIGMLGCVLPFLTLKSFPKHNANNGKTD